MESSDSTPFLLGRSAHLWHNGGVKPLDPRLLRYAASAKRYIIEIAAVGLISSILVIAQAFLISSSATPIVSKGASFGEIKYFVLALTIVVFLRAGLHFWRESRGHKAADATITDLRHQVITKSVDLGPRWQANHGTTTAALLTRGLNDLDPYFVKFLPQLLLVATVTPITLIVILILDFWSALIALITIPLIPVFMILIGRLTMTASQKRLKAMTRLSSQLLDLIAGIPTLVALGRQKAPRPHLVKLSQQNTKATMQTLQVAFLSGAVLEFLATLSVALIAVEVGFRMVFGNLDLFTGLAIIMLAPEVYEPLRQVGTQFHASNNGITAAKACFEILETPSPEDGTVAAPKFGGPEAQEIRIENLSVAARGAWAPRELTATIHAGQITALAGPSGAGKTTTAMVLLKLQTATKGRVFFGSHDLSSIENSSLWEQVGWLPQSPTIVPGTILENVLNGQEVDESTLMRAATMTGFLEVVENQADGWQTALGEGGIGLSVGQRQRLALTRTLLFPPSLLVMDEPTAHLDALSESQVVDIIRHLQESGVSVVVIAHRQAVLNAADQVISVPTGAASADDLEEYPQLQEQLEMESLDVSTPGLLRESEEQQ